MKRVTGVARTRLCGYFLPLRLFSSTARRLKDVKRNDFGEARRLSFEERSERRSGKTAAQKEALETTLLEAERYVDSEFEAELDLVHEKIMSRANIIALRVTNMAKCLEQLEFEGSGGKKVMIVQAAQVVKASSTEIDIIPFNKSMEAPIFQRLARFDASLTVTKQKDKITVKMSPMTTARREKAVKDLEVLIGELRLKVKTVRAAASKYLQGLRLHDQVMQEHQRNLDEIAKSYVDVRVQELEALQGEVMTMGVDESDQVGSEGAQ
jgi:ribosome recycling factor